MPNLMMSMDEYPADNEYFIFFGSRVNKSKGVEILNSFGLVTDAEEWLTSTAVPYVPEESFPHEVFQGDS